VLITTSTPSMDLCEFLFPDDDNVPEHSVNNGNKDMKSCKNKWVDGCSDDADDANVPDVESDASVVTSYDETKNNIFSKATNVTNYRRHTKSSSDVSYKTYSKDVNQNTSSTKVADDHTKSETQDNIACGKLSTPGKDSNERFSSVDDSRVHEPYVNSNARASLLSYLTTFHEHLAIRGAEDRSTSSADRAFWSSGSSSSGSLGRSASLTDLSSFTADISRKCCSLEYLSTAEDTPGSIRKGEYWSMAKQRTHVNGNISLKNDNFCYKISDLSDIEIENDLNFLSTCGNKTSTPDRPSSNLWSDNVTQAKDNHACVFDKNNNHSPLLACAKTLPQNSMSPLYSQQYSNHVNNIKSMVLRNGNSPEVTQSGRFGERLSSPHQRTFTIDAGPRVRRSLFFLPPRAAPSSEFRPWYNPNFRNEDEEAVYYLVTKYLDNDSMAW